MIPDHVSPNRAAPETYDRDWFLAQLNGRDPTAPRDLVAPADDAVEEAAPDELPVADEDEVFAISGSSAAAHGRRAGALVGAVAALVLVASVAFAASTLRAPEEPAGAQDRPSETSLPMPLASGTPAPQLTTLPFAGDAPRNSGTPAHDEDQSPGAATSSSPTTSDPSGTPTPTPTPTETDTPTPTPDPTTTDPTDPTSPDPDPAPTDCILFVCSP